MGPLGLDSYSSFVMMLLLLSVISFVVFSFVGAVAAAKGYRYLKEKNIEKDKLLQVFAEVAKTANEGLAEIETQLNHPVKETTKGKSSLASSVTFKLKSDKLMQEVFKLVPTAVTTPPLRWREKSTDQEAATFKFVWKYPVGSFPPDYDGFVTTSMFIKLDSSEDADTTLLTCRIQKTGPEEMLFSGLEEQAIELTKKSLAGALQAIFVPEFRA